ncbi:hypothetical protein DER46DRAFT_580380 [Fusarium sp. MPI-SDFR-AT-0072]|nr:hypothetical protein DER46DRAFT_580380 [Fusarium sp. MPI-SDFR-AT-0072]
MMDRYIHKSFTASISRNRISDHLPHSRRQAPESNEKNKRKHACQTSINTHPSHAPEGKTTAGVEIIKQTVSIQQLHETTTAILADRARGPIGVGSVALLGNQEKVEYYRNDSPGEVVSDCWGPVGIAEHQDDLSKWRRD